MLNKSSLAEFVKKHSFAIELSFLLAFVALYFVPIAFNSASIRFTFTWLTSKQIGRVISALLYLFIIICSIIAYIFKKHFYIIFSILYSLLNIIENIIFKTPLSLPLLNMYFAIILSVILLYYRWYQFSLRNGYWVSPKFKMHRKQKHLSNKQRIEQLEKEIEELKKGNQE